jgi:hypothetical protein
VVELQFKNFPTMYVRDDYEFTVLEERTMSAGALAGDQAALNRCRVHLLEARAHAAALAASSCVGLGTDGADYRVLEAIEAALHSLYRLTTPSGWHDDVRN